MLAANQPPLVRRVIGPGGRDYRNRGEKADAPRQGNFGVVLVLLRGKTPRGASRRSGVVCEAK